MSEFMLQTLERIEKNQKAHSEHTSAKLEDINRTMSMLVTQQKNDEKTNEDHEKRIRKTETVVVKVTTFFSAMSVAFGAAVTWAVDKLLSIGS